MKEILINVESKELRVAILKNKKLHDLVIERKKSRQITGNIYRGKVTNILKNIQSAFIDIGEGDNGFIHISDIMENTQKFREMFDMDFDSKASAKESKENSAEETDITKILKPGQTVLVQVVKEPIGSKGARLTSNISIPGRFLVLLPNSPHRGVSKKITDNKARTSLKNLIKAFEMPSEMGLICRTSCLEATREQLIDEAHELIAMWENTRLEFEKSKGTSLLYQESDIIKRTLIKALDKKFARLLVDNKNIYNNLTKMAKKYGSKESTLKIEYYRDTLPIFKRFGVEKEIGKAANRKIWLQSGGYLFFERTEAMYTVDVNSGRGGGKKDSGKDVEEAIVNINMEAADEIARQLSIRNIGGLVICDFIDMRFRKNGRRVLDRLKAALKEDSAKITILGMSEFGLVEMTRQRNRESLLQTMYTECPYCFGKGLIKNFESSAIDLERAIHELVKCNEQYALEISLHPRFEEYLSKEDKSYLMEKFEEDHAKITFKTDDTLHLSEFEIYNSTSGELLEV
ncbi:Rne/Rng family ribonuclease [bacterium]|nr:Rne/Rng family ribonuclease [bacterium]